MRPFTGGLARQPLAALASPVLHHAHSTPVAHPLQESVHAFAIPLFGLESSLDSSPPGGVQKPGENRGSVQDGRVDDRDSACVTYPSTYMPCDTHRPLLHFPPGSSRGSGSGSDPVQIESGDLIYVAQYDHINVQHRFHISG